MLVGTTSIVILFLSVRKLKLKDIKQTSISNMKSFRDETQTQDRTRAHNQCWGK